MMVPQQKSLITSSSNVDGYDASHSAMFSKAPNSGTPTTDHRLMCANRCLKLKAPPGSPRHHHPDISRRRTPQPSIRYDALADSTDQWDDFKNTITACAAKCLGRRRTRPKKPWVTPVTLEITARLHGDLKEYRRLNSVRNASNNPFSADFFMLFIFTCHFA